MASFQARLNASWIPVFMPCPEAGLCTCAASPATNTRPSPIRGTIRCCAVNTDTQPGGSTRTGLPTPALSLRENRSAIAAASPSSCTSTVSSMRQRSVPGSGAIMRLPPATRSQ